MEVYKISSLHFSWTLDHECLLYFECAILNPWFYCSVYFNIFVNKSIWMWLSNLRPDSDKVHGRPICSDIIIIKTSSPMRTLLRNMISMNMSAWGHVTSMSEQRKLQLFEHHYQLLLVLIIWSTEFNILEFYE